MSNYFSDDSDDFYSSDDNFNNYINHNCNNNSNSSDISSNNSNNNNDNNSDSDDEHVDIHARILNDDEINKIIVQLNELKYDDINDWFDRIGKKNLINPTNYSYKECTEKEYEQLDREYRYFRNNGF